MSVGRYGRSAAVFVLVAGTVALVAATVGTGGRSTGEQPPRTASTTPSESTSATSDDTARPDVVSAGPALPGRDSGRATNAPTRSSTSSSRRTSTPAAASRLPLDYSTGSATQVITVVSSSRSATTASLQRWTKSASGWHKVGAAVFAHVGADGVTSNAREGYSGTPAGSWSLTEAFGRLSDPGTALPYFRTDLKDWWAGDSSSRATYNTHQRCAASSCSFNTNESEQLYAIGPVYDYAVVIDYNRWPAVAGKGSAFFLHVTDGQPTGGCVAVAKSDLVAIMQWLNPGRHPRILIGVG